MLPSRCVTERRRRWSDTYKGVADSDDEGDGKVNGKLNGNGDIDPKLRREEHELAKIETGIAQVLCRTAPPAGRSTTSRNVRACCRCS